MAYLQTRRRTDAAGAPMLSHGERSTQPSSANRSCFHFGDAPHQRSARQELAKRHRAAYPEHEGRRPWPTLALAAFIAGFYQHRQNDHPSNLRPLVLGSVKTKLSEKKIFSHGIVPFFRNGRMTPEKRRKSVNGRKE